MSTATAQSAAVQQQAAQPKAVEAAKAPPRIAVAPNEKTIEHLTRWAKEDRRTVALFTTMLLEKVVEDRAAAEAQKAVGSGLSGAAELIEREMPALAQR